MVFFRASITFALYPHLNILLIKNSTKYWLFQMTFCFKSTILLLKAFNFHVKYKKIKHCIRLLSIIRIISIFDISDHIRLLLISNYFAKYLCCQFFTKKIIAQSKELSKILDNISEERHEKFLDFGKG